MRKVTVREIIDKAERKMSSRKPNAPVLSLAEQLKAAQSLLKPVNRDSLKAQKEEEQKRLSACPTPSNRTANISALAA